MSCIICIELSVHCVDALPLRRLILLLGRSYTETNSMFQTDEIWEDVEGATVLRKLANLPGLRQYWCVEVPLNLQLFHVDILSGLAGQRSWSRFMFDDVRRILPILSGYRSSDVRVSMQTRRIDRVGYKILRITKILVGVISDGVENFAFVDDEGARYYESIADLSIGEFRHEKVIWTSRSTQR